MRGRILVLSLGAAAIAVPVAAQTATAVFDALSSAPQEQAAATTSVKFREDRHQRMTVPVRLADAGPYRFLVDTGADRTSISRELVESLKLQPGQSAQLHSVTGITPVTTATIPDLRFSGDSIVSVEAPVLERGNIGADGILALDSLRSQRVKFDFRNNTMSVLRSPRKSHYDEPGTIVVRARQQNGRLVLSKARADGMDIVVVIDTGSEMTIGNDALRRRLARNLKPDYGTVALQSVTGQMLTGEYTVLRRLQFGGVGLHQLAIVFADAHTFKQLGLDRKPAILLGMNAMRAFDSVSIDFAQKKIRLLPPGAEAVDGFHTTAID